jgi:hypothetical protein
MFVACDGYQPRQMERRDNNSWSITLFEQIGGPLHRQVRLEPQRMMLMSVAANVGSGTMLSSLDYFDATKHVESLIAIDVNGQNRIEVGGRRENYFIQRQCWLRERQFCRSQFLVGRERNMGRHAHATALHQRTRQGFIEVADETANGTYAFDDSATHANIDAWYRVGFQAGEYTSGSATVTFIYNSGGARLEARVFACAITCDRSANRISSDIFEDASLRA